LLPVLKWLAKARQIRGSWLDPFHFSPEKAVDRRLLADYEADLDLIASIRNQPAAALQLANWPAEVRGFGPIRNRLPPRPAKRERRWRNGTSRADGIIAG
jgi:indolepyruvate ferredoxin oxidoreductase